MFAPLRLSLELEPGSEPLSGRITETGGNEHPFTGWLHSPLAIEVCAASSELPETTAHPVDTTREVDQ